MNAADAAEQIASTIQALIPAIERLLLLARRVGLWPRPSSTYSYENLSLSLTLDIRDRTGRTAVVHRRQRVRFLTSEAGIVTNPVSGEGKPLDGYKVTGAVRVGSRREGSHEVQLLTLAERPRRHTTAKLVSERRILNGFPNEREYFESTIERPTKRLTIRALFPKGRPPKDAVIVSTPGQTAERLKPRLNREGRALLSWSRQGLLAGSRYCLRWSW